MPKASPSAADRVERWPLARIRESARNPRAHSPEQVDAIAASMREFGWTIPLLVDESGELIAGHGRLRAARELGAEDAPVLVAKGWTEAQKRAYRIADNKLALNASWDASILSDELATLASEGFAVDLVGFSDDDLARLVDDTDRLALDHAAASAIAADPTDWRHAAGSPATSFASGAAQESNAGGQAWTAPAGEASPAPAAPVALANPRVELAVFSCMVTLADRPALFDAIARAKERGAPDSGAALVIIAREWMGT
jgi:hypothetical protein